MATEVIALRLPAEQIEALKKVADSRAIRVSDLMKEMVTDGLEGVKKGVDNSAQIAKLTKQMEQLEETLTGRQDRLAKVMMADLKLTAATRYLAQMAVENSDEVVSYISSQKALDPKTKISYQERRAKQEAMQGEYWAKKASDEADEACKEETRVIT